MEEQLQTALVVLAALALLTACQVPLLATAAVEVVDHSATSMA
jgi:uncharacterized lipoprotein YajG